MGPLLTKLAGLQDELRRTFDAARMKKPGSQAAIAETVALATYQDFLRDTAIDFEIAARAASERPASMDWLVNKVAALIVDNVNFDAVAAQANWCNKAVVAARHEAENLRQEVKELRALVERLTYLDEQRAKRVA